MVVFLAGISLMQAQVQIQKKPENPGKPDKPSEPQATWAVRIPIEDSGNMLYGMESTDGLYENGSSTEVKVEKNDFSFVLKNENLGSPPSKYVRFQGVNVGNWDDIAYPDEGRPCCQFPDDLCAGGDCIGLDCDPGCMADFLNSTHPHPDYVSFYIYVWITSDKDIESMIPGEIYGFGSACAPGGNGDYFIMVARYRDKCEANPAYHDIEFYRNINYEALVEKGEPMNIAIERLNEGLYEAEYGIGSDGVWRIRVLDYDLLNRTFPASLSLPEYINLKVQERYCERNKGRATWYYSMEAKGDFYFYIDFIKNPVTQ